MTREIAIKYRWRAGYQIRKFPDLGITSNTSTGVMAKTLFTAKGFGRMAHTNLPDHENRRLAYPAGYTRRDGRGPALRNSGHSGGNREQISATRTSGARAPAQSVDGAWPGKSMQLSAIDRARKAGL